MQLPGGLKKGETFLDISLDAYHWSVWMEHSGFNLLKVVDHFFVMTEDQMESFFKFRDMEENSVYSNDDVLLPERQLLRIYCKDNDINIITTVRFGMTFIHIPMAEIDSLCDWIDDKIVNL